MIRGQIKALDDLTEYDRALWARLCDENPHLRSPYFSHQFANILNQHGQGVFVCCFYEGDETVGYLPFHYRPVIGQTLKSAVKVGGHMSDYFGVIANKDWRPSPAALLRAAGIKSFKFDHLIEHQALIGLTAQPYGRGTRIQIGGDAAEFLNRALAEHSSYLKQLVRQERVLERDVGQVRIAHNEACGAEALHEIISRKREQYRRSNSTDALESVWSQKLLTSLLQSRDPQCSGVISTLHAGNIWAAAHFGIRFRDALHWWFPVYNHVLRKYSPGSILLRRTIEQAQSLGLSSIDFGCGDSPYKKTYPHEEYAVYGGYWCEPGVFSFIDRALWSAQWRLSKLRRRTGAIFAKSKSDS